MKNTDETEYELTLEEGETLVLKRKDIVNIIFVVLEIFLLCVVINMYAFSGTGSSADDVPVYTVNSKNDILGNSGEYKRVILSGWETVYDLKYGKVTLGIGVERNIVPEEIEAEGSNGNKCCSVYLLYGENVLSENDVLYVLNETDFNSSNLVDEIAGATVHVGSDYLYFSEK